MLAQATLNTLQKAFTSQRPFVIFALPDSESISMYIQKDDEIHVAGEDCVNAFVFSPFMPEGNSFCIPYAQSDYIETTLPTQVANIPSKTPNVNPSEKAQHEHLVAQAVTEIKKGKAQKIVVSRKAVFSLSSFSLEALISQLFSMYAATFRYVWYHPDTGLWCGATPETLLNAKDGCFKTMALAGTRPSSVDVKKPWGEKEVDEHQIVIDEIVKNLEKCLSVIKVSKTHTYTAGPVAHLRTDIMGCVKKGKSSLFSLANNLHPTSAICGFPRDKALKFIVENESYDREYYTGFLGPISSKEADSSLFVNLRCMKIEEGQAHVYVGGGITLDSIPSEEWQETQNKLATMVSVLAPFLVHN